MKNYAFTLVELSIVIIIIALIIGGVLVGQDLVAAGKLRSAVGQIDNYKTAVYVFKNKYGKLPGDIGSARAAQFGLLARGSVSGSVGGVGDENDQIQGRYAAYVQGRRQNCGETRLFWRDLVSTELIGDSITKGNGSCQSLAEQSASGEDVNNYFPQSKLGTGHVVVWSYDATTINKLGIAKIDSFTSTVVSASPVLSPKMAYSIDAKYDDGMPTSGRITNGVTGIGSGTPYGNSTAIASTTNTYCTHNNSSAYTTQYYAVKSDDTPRCYISIDF